MTRGRAIDGSSGFGDTFSRALRVDTNVTPGPLGVAYVLPGLGRGGAESHLRNVLARIDRQTFSPCVVSTAGSGPMEPEFAALGIPTYPLEYRGISMRPAQAGPLFRDALRFFRSFSDILRKHDVKIVHSYLPAANILGTLVATACRARVKIVSKRALCRYKSGHPVFSFFEDLANLAADAVMVNSLAVARDIRRTERFLRDKVFLVYNGASLDDGVQGGPATPPADLEIPPGAVLVTYIAHLREDKGHLCLVDAARTVVAACPATRFLFVGNEGSEAASVRERIRSLELTDKVLLTGPREDIAAILGASRIVAHPGEEGFSNAILEAMAAGLPVVAAAAGGNPEAIVDGETGILVPPGNAASFAAAILSLLHDPARANAMGRAGRRLVEERFSMEKMVSSVETSYRELLEGKPLSCRIRAPSVEGGVS